MIRIVSYNVNGGLDTAAVGNVLAWLKPDLVCLLEAPGRLGQRRIAKAAGLSVISRAGKRRLSTAILASERVRVLSHNSHVLAAPSGVPDRAVAHAIVGIGGLRLSVAAAQLGMRPEVREGHVAELERFLANVDLPSVLCCDLNESAKGPSAARLAEVLQDAFAVAGTGHGDTYPTPDPSTRQDFVFVDPSLAIERAHVPTEPPIDIASHHRPVVVDLAGSDEEPGRLPLETEDEASTDTADASVEPAA